MADLFAEFLFTISFDVAGGKSVDAKMDFASVHPYSIGNSLPLLTPNPTPLIAALLEGEVRFLLIQATIWQS